MLTSIDVKFIFDSARLLASLGDKGFFSSANILQIANVVHRVVFLLFILCFQPNICQFLPCESSKKSSTILYHSNNSTSSQGSRSTVLISIIWQFCCTIDVISSKSQNSSKFGQQQLVMMNYVCDFSQSETETTEELFWRSRGVLHSKLYQKQLQLVPRSSWITVQQSVNFAARLMSSGQYRKILPNLVNDNQL